VWLAADTSGARARAGRLYDGWLPYPPTRRAYCSGLTEVRAAAEGAGRAADAVTPALFVTVLVTDDADGGRAALDHFATNTYGAGIDVVEQIQTFAVGTTDTVAAQLASFIDAGARHLVCRIGVLGPDGFTEQLRQLQVVHALLR
jgi:alkanesulfonate monooxygenase SsuD/methylene tetrahydromethanopterin reductase-like flavin-dependent oxidoreductase (luciferase family)